LARGNKRILPVTVLAQGQHGLRNVCVSLPAIIGSQGVERILELELTEAQTSDLREAARRLTARTA
jgi:malate/lactate dehydrogenase